MGFQKNLFMIIIGLFMIITISPLSAMEIIKSVKQYLTPANSAIFTGTAAILSISKLLFFRGNHESKADEELSQLKSALEEENIEVGNENSNYKITNNVANILQGKLEQLQQQYDKQTIIMSTLHKTLEKAKIKIQVDVNPTTQESLGTLYLDTEALNNLLEHSSKDNSGTIVITYRN